MITKIAAAAVIATASLSFTSVGHAEDFYATPLQHGAPTDLPGEKLIPGVSEAMGIVNAVTQPILQPILAPGGAPAAEPAVDKPMKHHHAKHHKMMMKKEM